MSVPVFEQIVQTAKATAGDCDGLQILGSADLNGHITKVRYLPNQAITGRPGGRSYVIINTGLGGNQRTEVAAVVFDEGVDAAADVPFKLELNHTAGTLDVRPGEVLVLQSNAGPSAEGMIDPGGLWIVEIVKRTKIVR